MQTTLLATAYFPPIQYLTKFLIGPIIIEKHENYIKQSFRNRCVILAANGPLSLTVPTIKRHSEKTGITDVKIDYDLPWQKNHFKSIESAYKNSPFFDYYIDELTPFFEHQYKFLFEFNNLITKTILDILEIKSHIDYTSSFVRNSPHVDLREYISPKARRQAEDPHFEPAEYYQVFEDKYGFTPNLSIIDLLFNEGPNAKLVLQQSIKKGDE